VLVLEFKDEPTFMPDCLEPFLSEGFLPLFVDTINGVLLLFLLLYTPLVAFTYAKGKFFVD